MSDLRTTPKVAVNDVGSAEDFLAYLDATMKRVNDGDIVVGEVVRVSRDEVLVDIGYKTEGVIPLKEFANNPTVNPLDTVSVGDRMEAVVLTLEDKNGELLLSRRRALAEQAWPVLAQAYEGKSPVSGVVIEAVRGGLIVDLGLRAFLPASLVDTRRVKDLAPFVGTRVEAFIIEFDRKRGNVVLSRKALLQETAKADREEFLSQLDIGGFYIGNVTTLTSFGAFVNLGGNVDGLVHISELTSLHVDSVEEVLSPGDEVNVEVIDVDMETGKVSLSLRHLPHADEVDASVSEEDASALRDYKQTLGLGA